MQLLASVPVPYSSRKAAGPTFGPPVWSRGFRFAPANATYLLSHLTNDVTNNNNNTGPHKDGPLYEGRVAILSLGKEARLDFWGSLEDAKADCAAVAAAAAAVGADANADTTDCAPSSSSSSNNVTGASTDRCEDNDSGNATTTTGADSHACQSHRLVQKKAVRRKALASVRCEDCSLVVFEGQAYHDAWHGIASTAGSGSSSSSAATAAVPPTTTPTPTQAVATPNLSDGVGSGDGSTLGDGNGRDWDEKTAQKRLSFTIRRVARVIPADSLMEHPEARSEMERRRRGFERSVTETGVTAGAHAASAAASIAGW